MDAGGSMADAHAAEPCPSPAGLPIVPRIARAPRVDLDAVLWPLQRAARTPRGRSAGQAVIASVFVAALVAFAGVNVRDASHDTKIQGSALPHPPTASVHGHRTLAVLNPLEAKPSVHASSAIPARAGAFHAPPGSLSRR